MSRDEIYSFNREMVRPVVEVLSSAASGEGVGIVGMKEIQGQSCSCHHFLGR
jgi:hypothetical protein